MKTRITRLLASALLLAPLGVGAVDSAPVEMSTSITGASTIKTDPDEVLLETSFETVFPRLPWRVSRPPDAAEVDWGRTKHRASHGQYSIYCAGMGPEAPGDGGPAPAGTASWAIVGPYDLSETTAGTLTFELWLRTEQYQDVFMWLVSTDGETFSGRARSTSTDGWQTVTTDLGHWGAAGDVIGESEIWIAFVYQSDHSNLFEGAYVDEVALRVDVGGAGTEGRTYTSNADFAEGVMVGVESTADRLELTDEWDALPFVWVPNSLTGTVSKVDTETGNELGRYATGPDAGIDPAVAAVDFQGSCWVGNRAGGTVVKVGLLENGGCVDRNADGEITTSRDANGDGDIAGGELLDWGEDECVLVETVLVQDREETYVPGEDHDDYAANNLQALAVDREGDLWVGIRDSQLLYRLNGDSGAVVAQIDVADEATFPSAAVVDGNGLLWVSSWADTWLLSVEPSTGDIGRVDLSHGTKGLGLGVNDHLAITGFDHQAVSRIKTTTGEADWTRFAYSQANGVATSETGGIWVVAPASGVLTRYSPLGDLNRTVNVPGLPTGVAVDQDGKVWVVTQSDSIYRYEPNFATFELQKALVGSGAHNATGDLTGIVARNLTTRFGSWTAVFDSTAPGTPWGRVSWVADVTADSTVAVRVRSSEDAESWSAWEAAADGLDLALTPPGRYLQIQASLHWLAGDQEPVLQELTVIPVATQEPPVASFTWSPAQPTVGQSIQFTDTSSGNPTSWSWDFGDESTSEEQNPEHAFLSEGPFDVSLTVGNDLGADTVSIQFTLAPASGCSIDCAASAPPTAELGEAVSFAGSAVSTDCTDVVGYSWTFGDGETSAEQSPTFAYSSTGTYRWAMTATADDASCVSAGDITVVGAGPDECLSTYWVPVVSHADGLGGSVWRSDLGLLGVDPAGVAAELRLHGIGSAPNRVITVAPGAMVTLTDVAAWIDSGFDGSGALEICADGELVVTSRTYSVLAAGHDCFPEGTFGQFLGGNLGAAGLAAGELARLGQLRESAAFRTNLGLVNTGSAAATVEIGLFDATGAELSRFEVDLDPGRWRQENRPFKTRADRDDLDAASATATVIAGDGIFVYASVVDNRTNDATTIPMR